MIDAHTARAAVAMTEMNLRRTYRKSTDNVRSVALFAGVFVMVAGGLTFGLGGKGAYYYGTKLAAGEYALVRTTLEGAAISALLLLFSMGTFRALVKSTTFDPETVFLSVRLGRRTQFVSQLCYESLVLTLMFGTPLVVPIVVFAFVGGAPVAVVSLLAGLVVAFFTATMVGFVLGFTANFGLRRVGLQDEGQILGFIGFIALTEAVFLGREYVLAVLARPPLTWFADALLLTVPGMNADPVGAALAFASPVVLFVPTIAAARRLAETVWYDEGPTFGDDEHAVENPTDSPLFEYGRRVLPERSLTVTALSVRAAIRSPLSKAFAIGPLILVAFAWLGYVDGSEQIPPAAVPAVTALLGASAVGNLFTMNPLGDDVVGLPWLLSTPLSAREYVWGKLAAAALVGVPLVAAMLAVSVALVGWGGPGYVALVAVYGLAMTVAAPFVAVGIGATYPQLDRSTAVRGEKTTLPDRKASILFGVAMLVPGLFGFGGTVAYRAEQFDATLAAAFGAVGVSVVLLGVAALVSYRLALRRVDGYEIGTEV